MNKNSIFRSPVKYDTIIVESVFISEGRKHIRFNYLLDPYGETEYFEFIEGVGTNIGLFYQRAFSLISPHYLLCAFKDGIRTYKNQSNIFGGQCYIELTGIGFDNDSQDNGSDEGMSLFPNPSLDRLNIHFEEESLKSKNIFVFTPSGLLVKSLLTDSDLSDN